MNTNKHLSPPINGFRGDSLDHTEVTSIRAQEHLLLFLAYVMSLGNL